MKKKFLTLLLCTAMACAPLTGCGKNTSPTDTSAKEETPDTQKDGSVIYGRVKSIQDDTITLTLQNMNGPAPGGNGSDGSMSDGEMDEPPSISDGEMGGPPAKPGDDTGQPPSMSDGEMDEPPAKPGDDTGQPPSMSDGEMDEPPAKPGDDMGQPPAASDNSMEGAPALSGNDGGQHQPMGEEKDITVTKDTVYTLEAENDADTTDASLEDITEGCMLTVTLKEDRTTAAAITIRQGMPGPGGGAEASDLELSGAKTIKGKKISSSDESFSSTSDDENAVLVTDQGNLYMAGAVLSKSGDTSNEDNSNFYGLNAALAVTNAGTAELTNIEITSTGEGSNAIFATGEGSSITADNIRIRTTGDSARGLDATYGGTITASSVDITTEGTHCAALATDRGEGTITVNGATLSTAGEGSPCIYSTGDITVRNAAGTAARSQNLVVEGKNSIDLTDCELTGAGPNGLMLYQSTSGDAGEGTAVLHAANSKLTTTSSGPMIYVTNTDAEVTLTNTELTFPSGTLIQVSQNETNNWGIPGQNGGNLTLTGTQQILDGDISCDGISTVNLILSEKSTLTGAIDTAHTGKETSLHLDDSSTWNVTADSYLTSLSNTQESCSNIQSNGHTVYYDPAHTDNKWLDGQTLELPGGGKLTPVSA
ncbi:MAG: hypothetical protein HFH54_05715 [Lachnospiraceae bacterium]|nr:hypothetical protein [Lachnospiraceae bacterium]